MATYFTLSLPYSKSNVLWVKFLYFPLVLNTYFLSFAHSFSYMYNIVYFAASNLNPISQSYPQPHFLCTWRILKLNRPNFQDGSPGCELITDKDILRVNNCELQEINPPAVSEYLPILHPLGYFKLPTAFIFIRNLSI